MCYRERPPSGPSLTTVLAKNMKDEDVGDSPEEVFAQIGVTLLLVQQFEWMLERSLKLVFADKSELTAEKIFQADTRSLGLLMRDLRTKVSLSDDVDEFMRLLLKDRNLFVHNLRNQDWFDAHTKEGRDGFWTFIGRLTPQLEKGLLLFAAIHFKEAEDRRMPHVVDHILSNPEYYAAVRQFYPDVDKFKKKNGG